MRLYFLLLFHSRAVNGLFQRQGAFSVPNLPGGDQQTADFISCVAFGKAGEFAEKYLHKGTKICVSGRIQTGSYTRQDGTKVYTTDVVVEDQEFAESRNAQTSGPDYSGYAGADNGSTPAAHGNDAAPASSAIDGFMNIPDGIDEELPFN